MRSRINVTYESDPNVHVTDIAGGYVQLMLHDPVLLGDLSITATREGMRRILLSAVEQLQAFTPVDLSDAAGSVRE